VTAIRDMSLAMTRSLLRDRMTMFLTLLFPLVFLLASSAFLHKSGPVKVRVLEVGQIPVIDRLVGQASPLQVDRAADRAAAVQALREGKAAGLVEQFGDRILLTVSKTDPAQAATVRELVGSIVARAGQPTTGQVPPPLQLNTTTVGNPPLQPIQYLAPGLLGWAIATGAAFGSALTLTTWRQKGLLRRLRLSPVPLHSVVLARVGVSTGVSIVQSLLFIAVAALPYFGLKVSGGWWKFLPLVLAGTLAFLAIGSLVGAYARSAEGASGMVNLILLPMALLSGAFFPLDQAPSWMRPVAEALPLHHLVDGITAVLVRGQGWSSVLPHLGFLLAFTGAALLLATQAFRRRGD
jgi:ABC-2 type transport system permease protein